MELTEEIHAELERIKTALHQVSLPRAELLGLQSRLIAIKFELLIAAENLATKKMRSVDRDKAF